MKHFDGRTYLFSQWEGLESKFQFRVSNTYKVRDFVTRAEHIYQGLIPNGDPNTILSDDLIWTAGTPLSDTTTIIRALQEKQNSYNGRINVLGAYVMNELPLGRRMRVIYGVRMEKATNWYTGEPVNLSLLLFHTMMMKKCLMSSTSYHRFGFKSWRAI